MYVFWFWCVFRLMLDALNVLDGFFGDFDGVELVR